MTEPNTCDPATLPERLHADTRLLRFWVMTVGWFVASGAARMHDRHWRLVLRRIVRHIAWDVRGLIVDLACVRVVMPPAGRPLSRRPLPTPPGFRRGVANNTRRFRRMVRLRGAGVMARLCWLRRVLADLKRWRARIAARIARMKRSGRLIAVAPPASPLRAVARPAPACADTS